MFNKVQKENALNITVGIRFRIHCDLLVYMNFAWGWGRGMEEDWNGRCLYQMHKYSGGLF